MSDPPLPPINPDTAPFWTAARDGELVLQQCSDCHQQQFPPRARCLGCGGTSLGWNKVSPRGTVYSFSVVHRAPSAAFRADVPYVLALVEVAPRARMMMRLVDSAPEAIHIGMSVCIDFERRTSGEREAALPVARVLDEP